MPPPFRHLNKSPCPSLFSPLMIDLPQHRMLSPLSFSSDSLIHDTKFPSSHIYRRQPHTVQIIQLVEGPPPSPRLIASGSTPSSYDYSTEDSQSSEGEDEDEESVSTSYCSSDLPPEQLKSPVCNNESIAVRPELSSQTYSMPLKRILAWRENFSTQLSDTLSGMRGSFHVSSFSPNYLPDHSFSSSLKRKILFEGDDDQDYDSVCNPPLLFRSTGSSLSYLGVAFLQAVTFAVAITDLNGRRKRCLA